MEMDLGVMWLPVARCRNCHAVILAGKSRAVRPSWCRSDGT
jgi:hypothetical protein